MEYKYYLPDENNKSVLQTTQSNSVIIIGANGSGKSKLGEWMEKQYMQDIHRIGAQRSLTFGNYIQQKSYEQSTNWLMCGNENGSNDHNGRWGWDGEKYNYTSSLLNDYEHALSALMALKVMQQEKYFLDCKERESEGLDKNAVPETVVDVLQRIWQSVFPQRSIKLEDAKVIATFSKDGVLNKYKGKDMSDGERVALYLIAQALSVPKGKIIIIDEPEIHLHGSIMNRLWTSIEKERKDCLFIYITHDTQFAATHEDSQKIWVKSFSGNNWDWCRVAESDLPEQCLLDIMGNRKNVLFVEGEENSYDTQLYREIYKDYYVIPCGGCSKVISSTKAMKENPQLHHLKVFGIIDRDYRTQHEINKLREQNIFTLSVAEVENLFCVEELLSAINTNQGYSDDSRVNAVKDYIIGRFESQFENQVCNATVSEVKYKLSTYELPKNDTVKAKETLNKLFETIAYDEIREAINTEYHEVLFGRVYSKILTVFNQKELSKSIGHYFEIANKGYCELVIRLLKSDSSRLIMDAVIPYLPSEIPL